MISKSMMCRHHHHNFVNVVAKSFRNFAFSVLSIDSNCPKHEREIFLRCSQPNYGQWTLKDSSKSKKIRITALNFTTWQLTKTPGIILIINLHHHNQQWSIISFFLADRTTSERTFQGKGHSQELRRKKTLNPWKYSRSMTQSLLCSSTES